VVTNIPFAVPSVHFVCNTMLPVAANVWKSGQGVCVFMLLIENKRNALLASEEEEGY